MNYPAIRYEHVQERLLDLHSYDGTCRGVLFSSDEAVQAALAPGRAAIDVTAITQGFLPRGATLVSQARPGNIDRILSETRAVEGTEDPLAKVRLKFSIDLLIRRSKEIGWKQDDLARDLNPKLSGRYEAIVDELEAHNRRQQ